MSSYYYQSRRKKARLKNRAAGVLLVVSGAVLLVSAVSPRIAGRFGGLLHDQLFEFAGWASVVIPLFIGWLGIQEFMKERGSRLKDLLLFSAFFLSLACFLSLFHTASQRTPGGLGGWAGDNASLFLIQQFGAFLVYVFSAAAFFVSACLLARIPPAAPIVLLKQKIAEDLAHWKEEKKRIQAEELLKRKIFESEAPAPKRALPDGKPVMVKETAPGPELTRIVESRLKSLLKKSEPAAPPARPASAPASGEAGGTETDPYQNYVLPDPELLTVMERNTAPVGKEELYANGTHLEQTLEQFGVKAKVIDIHPGPVITRYDLSPAPGVRVQQIESLADDIALAMKAQSLRVLAPVPGKAAVGIEISNSSPATVYLKEMIISAQFQKHSRLLPLAIGKTTEGDSYIADLASMPHLLIAGATGSGKSVCIHAIILSLLFKFRPDEVKFLLIDPKRLELPGYDGIPHLYDPAETPEDVKVITQPKDVVTSLKKLIEVMDSRYASFAALSVRNIEGYNEKARAQKIPRVPYIVVVIDELADLMIVVGKEVEEMIQRLAQMARAVGIHLILATQRPSVDIITGVIKANLPSRIAFQVLSKTDSRVILDSQGAEDLLGKGDMLFLATGAPKPIRLQGAFVSESDVAHVIQFIKEQDFKPSYEAQTAAGNEESIVDSQENRALLLRAAKVVKDTEKVSGDLLRADKEIGSRYDLALILLKKKGLIEKPKDTNRWKIHFDRLEDFLTQVEAQG